MLTETHGPTVTRAHIWWYSVALAPFALGLGLTSIGGWVYLVLALVLNALFLRGAWTLWHRTEQQALADGHKAEKSLFRFSLIEAVLRNMAVAA